MAYKIEKVTWGCGGDQVKSYFGVSPLNKTSSFSWTNAWGIFSSAGTEVSAKYENKTYYWYSTSSAYSEFNENNILYYWLALIP